jgi:hypothetical protein
MNTNKADPLAGVVRIGIWPGMSLDRRQDDWVVGWIDCYNGRHHQSIRVRNEDRDKAYAYFARATAAPGVDRLSFLLLAHMAGASAALP